MRKYCLSFLSLLAVINLPAQTPNRYHPYSFVFTQKLDHSIYNKTTAFHSSFKPLFIDDPVIVREADSIFNYGLDSLKRSFVHRKLFNEHLIEINKESYTFFANYLPDLQVGKETEGSRKTWLNTRGFEAGGTIGTKFSFYTNIFENQARLPGYLSRIIDRDSIIPGQTIESHLLAGRPVDIADWAYSSAVLSYTPVKYVNLQLGYDKNFIGDGYRSMLLSDVAANYPFFKTSFELGKFRLMSMWAQLLDLHAEKLSYENGYRKKWAAIHYLDWNVNSRLSLGLFESVIWQDADKSGKRGFDLSYANPLLLLRPVERQNGSPDNGLIGLNLKYEIADALVVYGQFNLDELYSKEFFKKTGYWANKWGMQLGIRGAGVFNVRNLHYLAEFNAARPYTFSEKEPINNYAHYSQPLAHPFGANFKEWVGKIDYGFKRVDISLQLNRGLYGVDAAGKNSGKDIYKSYDDHDQDYGNRIGQGIRTDFLYTDARITYMIKPKVNFRLEAGFVYRKEANTIANDQTSWFTFGVRTSFRNLYQDF